MKRRAALVAVVVVASLVGPAGPAAAAVPAPVADSFVVQKNASAQTLNVLQNDAAVGPGAAITAVTAAAHGTAAIGADQRSVTYVPVAGYAGPDTFDYTVTDPTDGPATATVTIKVNAPPLAFDDPASPGCNPSPTAFGGAFPVVEDYGQLVTFGACAPLGNDTDSDGTVVDWVIVDQATHGEVEYIDPQFVAYTPDADYGTFAGDLPGGTWQSDSFTYRAIDNDGGLSAPATMRYWVAAINDAPFFVSAPPDVTVAEDSGPYDADWSALTSPGPANESGQQVTFVVKGIGLPSQPPIFSQPPAFTADGHLTFTPLPNAAGIATIRIFLQDDGGLEDYGGGSIGGNPPDDTSEDVTFDIIVTAATEVPVAGPDTLTVAEDDDWQPVDVLANDTDADSGDVLTITGASGASKGSVAVATDQLSLSYRPNANATGSDSFTYTVSDGNGGTATGTVNVTITPANDDPNAVNDGVPTPFKAYLRAGPTPLPVLANDVSLPDGPETLRIVSVTQGAHGAVAITGSGTGLTYAAAGSTLGIDVFTYTLSDGNGGLDTATVQVNVLADTTAPRAAITGLTKRSIVGSTRLRVTVTWTLAETGSGVKSQLLQRRTDSGAWVTVALPSSTTRSVALALARGHKYTFRVRGVDRSGNVGLFASRYLYI